MSQPRESENLPVRAFPLQDPALEQTKIYYRKLGEVSPTVVAGFRDPGAANSHLPVITELIKLVNVYIVTDSRGQQNLEQAGLDLRQETVEDSSLLAISKVLAEADVVLTGRSDNHGNEVTLMANSLWERLQGLSQRPLVMGLEDYPGGNAKWYKSQNTPEWIIPDYMCVVSEWAKAEELKYLPANFNPDNIFVTGQPAFDRLAKEDRTRIRRETREKLGILDNVPLVTYMGTVSVDDPIGETARTLQVIVPSLETAAPKNFHLALRCHPRDNTDKVIYDKAFEPIKDQRVDTTGLTTDQVGITSDLVISNGSTTGIDAVYRGIPSVQLFVSPNYWYFKEAPKSHKEVLEKYPMPMVEDGASPLAINQRQLGEIIEGIFFKPEYRSNLEERMARWVVDGLATQRVTDKVLEMTIKHFTQRVGR